MGRTTILVVLVTAAACGFDSKGQGATPELGDANGSSSSGDVTTTTGAAATTANSGTSGTSTSSTTQSDTTTSTTDESTTSTTNPTATTGNPLDCDTGNGGCDRNASCDDTTGAIVCTCGPGYQGSGQACEVDAALEALRVETPCLNAACNGAYCGATSAVAAIVAMSGNADVLYDVTVRVRGVAEQKTYLGGTSDGFWNEGGTPQNDDWNVYRLDVDSPATSYFLNAGSSYNPYCDALDYTQTITVRGGAALRLAMLDNNTCSTRNMSESGSPIVIPGIPPAPDPFNGQFVQIDAIEIVPQ